MSIRQPCPHPLPLVSNEEARRACEGRLTPRRGKRHRLLDIHHQRAARLQPHRNVPARQQLNLTLAVQRNRPRVKVNGK